MSASKRSVVLMSCVRVNKDFCLGRVKEGCWEKESKVVLMYLLWCWVGKDLIQTKFFWSLWMETVKSCSKSVAFETLVLTMKHQVYFCSIGFKVTSPTSNSSCGWNTWLMEHLVVCVLESYIFSVLVNELCSN